MWNTPDIAEETRSLKTPHPEDTSGNLLSSKPRTTLDLLLPREPDEKEEPSAYTSQMKKNLDRRHGARYRSYEAGNKVFATNYDGNRRGWTATIIERKIGDVMYEVLLSTAKPIN